MWKLDKLYTSFWHSWVIGALALTTSLAFAAGGQNKPEWVDALTAQGKPITVFTARKIYTMDPGRPEADAIAVLDGKVFQSNR